MQIVCERSGGFAGLTTRFEVDSATLTAAQQRELQRLIEQSHLLDQPAAKKRKSRNAVADGYQYDVTINTEDGKTTLSLNEGAVSEETQALLDWLIKVKSEE